MDDTRYPTVTAEQFEAAYEQAATALAAYVAARDRARLAEQDLAEVRLRNATARAADLRARWERAEADLDALRCDFEAPTTCRCVSRLGHAGDHEPPTGMRLVV